MIPVEVIIALIALFAIGYFFGHRHGSESSTEKIRSKIRTVHLIDDD